MDSFELNKIAGAVLTAALVIFGGRTLMDIAGADHAVKPGYVLPKSAPAGGGAAASAGFKFTDVATLLPKGNAESGQDSFKKCLACHAPEKGGANKVGPPLWGVIGKKVGDAPGFAYSDAVKSKGGTWTWEALATYLNDPRGAIPGNKMAFAGIKDTAELADLLVYMRKLSDAPAPLPN
jgi:cytochrome c